MATENGAVRGIVHPGDKYQMNWCSDFGNWGSIHSGLIRKRFHKDPQGVIPKRYLSLLPLVQFEQTEESLTSVYGSEDLQVTVKRYFEDDKLVERYVFKNLREDDLFLQHGDVGILLPFNDVYTYAEDCLTNRCNTHIWAGENCTYVNALKMGKSDINLGLVLTEGAIQSYSVYNTFSNQRGQFLMNLPHLELLSGEEYVIEWKIFWHEGKDDFLYETIGDVLYDMTPICFIPLFNTIMLIITLIVYVILSIWYFIWIKTPLHKWWDKLMNIKLK